MKKVLLLLLAFGLTFGFAQQAEIKPLKKISVESTYLNAGIFYHQADVPQLNEVISQFGAGSLWEKVDYSTFQGGFYSNSNVAPGINFGLSMRFADKERKQLNEHLLLNVGLNFKASNMIYGSYFYERTGFFTNLVSSDSSIQIRIDSTYMVSDHFYLNNRNGSLDLNLSYATNLSKRLSFCVGLGLNAGLSFSKSLIADRYGWRTYRADGNMFFSFDNENFPTFRTNIIERKELKSSFTANIYTPISGAFRISKKRPFWSKVQVFYEFRPGVDLVQTLPGSSYYLRPSMQQGFGFKYKI